MGAGKKRPKGGRPRNRLHGVPYHETRLRPETLKSVKILAALLDWEQGDLIDEAVRVGVAYIYTRRRQNLANPITEIPEIFETLGTELTKKEFESLKGTEYPPYGPHGTTGRP